METIIKISNLSKRFNETVALDNCSFTIEKRRGFRISGTFWRWQNDYNQTAQRTAAQ